MSSPSQPGATGAAAATGPVAPRAGIRLQPVPGVTIDGGLWAARRQVNREVTLPAGRTCLEDDGSFDNLRRPAGRIPDGPSAGSIAADSHVYKWLEALAWEQASGPDPEQAGWLRDTAALIAAAQEDDGYLNTRFRDPAVRFADLAHGHELYCAGHLIQAAVAQQRVTGDGQLTGVAVRFADYLCSVFGPAGRQAVPGHPEIETALIELTRLTGQARYLDLARYFIDHRGLGLLAWSRYGPAYYQDRVPLRQTRAPEGHAVRALYLAAGAADLAAEDGDDGLLSALLRQWDAMVSAKTYLTGGVGARWEGEAFGDPYELPPDRAYAETCAAIASVMWSWRLLLATGRAGFADLIERTLYNAVLPGIGLDGTGFFYVNPLQWRGGDNAMSVQSPGRGRQPWFGVACCPPSVMRFLSSLQHYFCTRTDAGVQVHQFAPGTITAVTAGGPLELRVSTGYPWDGEVAFEVTTAPAGTAEISVRVPAWCRAATVRVNGAEQGPARPGSYAVVSRRWARGDQLTLDLPMPVRTTTAAPEVDATRGCAALERGPLVYCVEQADLPGAPLGRLRLAGGAARSTWQPGLLGGVHVIEAPGLLAPAEPGPGFPYGDDAAAPAGGQAAAITAIPYYAWAHRGLDGMRVFIPEARP
jgi:uncharacterized protein